MHLAMELSNLGMSSHSCLEPALAVLDIAADMVFSRHAARSNYGYTGLACQY